MIVTLAAVSVDDLAARWLPLLLDATLKGTAILVLAGAALLAMRRASAAARQLVLLLALTSLLIVPVVSAALPGWRILPEWARLAPAAPTEIITPAPAQRAVEPPPELVPPAEPREFAPLAVGQETAPPVTSPPAASVAPARATPPPTPSLLARLMPWAMLLWAVGVLVFLVPLIAGRIAVWRLRRLSHRLTSGPLFDLVAKAQAHLRLTRRIVLLISPRRPMPMMWGILRPVLLLPAEAAHWSADRQWVVLLHELGHVKRQDMLTKLLANLACAMYWFNPLAWLAFRRFQTEAERACDDLVLSAGSSPGDYAQHILEIASGLQSKLFAVHGSIALARPSKLEGRLLAILDERRNRRTLTRWGLLLILILLAGLVVPISIMKATAADGNAAAKDSATTQPATRAAGEAASRAAADQWPAPLDEKWLAGAWVRKRAGKTAGGPDYDLLVMAPNHEWATAELWGEPANPQKVTVKEHGPRWEVERPGGPLHPSAHLTLWTFIDPADPAHHSGVTMGNIMWAGAKRLAVEKFRTITMRTEYQRCDETAWQAIAKLAGEAVPQLKPYPPPPATEWPGRPDETALVGSWVQRGNTTPPALLILRADRTWVQASVTGDLEKLLQVKVYNQGRRWSYVSTDEPISGRLALGEPVVAGTVSDGRDAHLEPFTLVLGDLTYQRLSDRQAAAVEKAVAASPATATQPATQPASAPAGGTADRLRIAQLVEQLADTDQPRREEAYRELVKIGEPAICALREVTRASSDGDYPERERLAAIALTEIIKDPLPNPAPVRMTIVFNRQAFMPTEDIRATLIFSSVNEQPIALWRMNLDEGPQELFFVVQGPSGLRKYIGIHKDGPPVAHNISKETPYSCTRALQWYYEFEEPGEYQITGRYVDRQRGQDYSSPPYKISVVRPDSEKVLSSRDVLHRGGPTGQRYELVKINHRAGQTFLLRDRAINSTILNHLVSGRRIDAEGLEEGRIADDPAFIEGARGWKIALPGNMTLAASVAHDDSGREVLWAKIPRLPEELTFKQGGSKYSPLVMEDSNGRRYTLNTSAAAPQPATHPASHPVAQGSDETVIEAKDGLVRMRNGNNEVVAPKIILKPATPATGPATRPAEEWGKPVDGVQVRLRYIEGVFHADIRNSGKRELSVGAIQQMAKLELDGRVFPYARAFQPIHSPFGPAREYHDIRIHLDSFVSPVERGKHTLLVAFTARPPDGAAGPLIEAWSNAVEFEAGPGIPPATQPATRPAATTEPTVPLVVVQAEMVKLPAVDDVGLRDWLGKQVGRKIAKDESGAWALPAKAAPLWLTKAKAVASATVVMSPKLMIGSGGNGFFSVSREGATLTRDVMLLAGVQTTVGAAIKEQGFALWGNLRVLKPGALRKHETSTQDTPSEPSHWPAADVLTSAGFKAEVAAGDALLVRLPAKDDALSSVPGITVPDKLKASGENCLYLLLQPSWDGRTRTDANITTAPAWPASQPATRPAGLLVGEALRASVSLDVPADLAKQRNALLATARAALRDGLIQLGEQFPQLKNSVEWQRVLHPLEGPPDTLELRLYNLTRKRAPDTSPERERFHVTVTIRPPPSPRSQERFRPLYPRLGLVGVVDIDAGDPAMEAALNKLLTDALAPLGRLEQSLQPATRPAADSRPAEVKFETLSAKDIGRRFRVGITGNVAEQVHTMSPPGFFTRDAAKNLACAGWLKDLDKDGLVLVASKDLLDKPVGDIRPEMKAQLHRNEITTILPADPAPQP